MQESERITKFLTMREIDLESLYRGNSFDGYGFVTCDYLYRGNGFTLNAVIFTYGGLYYKFAVVEYLQGEKVEYTVPFQVYKEEIEVKRTVYTNIKTMN